MDREWSKVEKVFGTNTNTTFCEFLFFSFLQFSKGTEGSKEPLCRSAHSNQLHCQELDRLRIACHLENCTLTCPIPLEILSPKIILSKAFFSLDNPKIIRTKKKPPTKAKFTRKGIFFLLQLSA